jgi:hypothetical protein
MNEFASVLISEEEKQQLEAYEQCRRRGYRYITVIYKGMLPAEAIHVQGLRTIEPRMVEDPNTGQKEWSPIESAGVTFFQRDLGGRIIAHVWDDDDEHNRFWLSRHTDLLEIEDEEMREKVEKYKKRAYRNELTEEEVLLKEKKKIEARLAALKKDEPEEEPEKIIKRVRGRVRRNNGNNKSTTDVDRAGMPRVAERGIEGQPSSAERSTQDT